MCVATAADPVPERVDVRTSLSRMMWISVIPDVGSVAAVDHVPEGVLVSASRDQLVADRLVPLPPGPVRVVDQGVLVWGRDLVASMKNRHRLTSLV